ncbi:MAG: hypothetical protein LC115_05885 [Bacteroidia bacterium]|nr:hypothetical protein [Bacteroidia bacterium]
MKRLLFLGAIAIFWVGCTPDNPNSKNTQPQDSTQASLADTTQKAKTPNIPTNRYWNDLALYLGGLPPTPESTLDSIDYRAEALEHQEYFEKAWKKKEITHLSKLASWAQQEISPLPGTDARVFYPFSGADFMTINTIYPNADSYLLFGLEPEGHLPELTKIKKERLRNNLANLEKSLASIMEHTFFKTINMATDFRSAELDGTLPALLAFIARKGNKILNVEAVKITPEGDVVAYTEKIPQNPQDSIITGVKVYFQKGETGKLQTMTYFSVDIGDNSLKKKENFLKLLQSQKPTHTYVKSASYLMHKDYFSTIRNTILDISQIYIQDDSGIPLKYFDRKQWDLTFYGVYTGTIPMFNKWKQKDLEEAYKDSTNTIKKLDFGIGYKYGNSQSNLMLAVKKNLKQ